MSMRPTMRPICAYVLLNFESHSTVSVPTVADVSQHTPAACILVLQKADFLAEWWNLVQKRAGIRLFLRRQNVGS